MEIRTELTSSQDATNYLQDLARHQQEPALLIKHEPLAAVLETLGAEGLSVPYVLEPYQISMSPYIGATSPHTTTEVVRWHPAGQIEAYVILEGRAEVFAKHRWNDNGWKKWVGEAGDMLVVRAESCHWSDWRSETGLALVFKAPQRAGVGRFPAGKVICKFCPHFQRGCVLPQGLSPNL